MNPLSFHRRSTMLAGGAVLSLLLAAGGASAQTAAQGATLEDTEATQLIAGTAIQQMLSISSTLGFRLKVERHRPDYLARSEQTYGMAAGDAERLTLWSSLTGSNNETGGLDQDTTAGVVGADYALTPGLLLGLSVAGDRSSGRLFNAVTEGYTVAPYLGWQIDKDWSLDATAGFGRAKTEFAAATVKPDRFFYGANLSYTRWSGNWQASGKLGYLYGEEKYASTLLNARNRIDVWRLAGQLSYWIDGGIMPFVGLARAHDNPRTAAAPAVAPDTDAWTWSTGVNFLSVRNGMTGGLIYNAESGRDNSRNRSLMAAVSLRF